MEVGTFAMRLFSWLCVLIASLFSTMSWAQSCGSAFTIVYRYNAAHQLTGAISPSLGGGHEALRNSYDVAGRLIKIERGVLAQCQGEDVPPANWSGFAVQLVTDRTYDVEDRLLTDRRSGPTLTQHSYDGLGRLECTAIRMNPAVYGALPTSACVLSAQGSHGPDRITRFVYDDAGQLLNEQRAYGTSIQQNYTTNAYSMNGRLDWAEDANGNRTDYSYDGFDRLIRINFPQTGVGAHAASASDYEQYGYDNNGNRTSKRLRSGETISYQFDALNRVWLKDLPGSTSDVTYTYDNFGLNLTAQMSGGASVSNTFNGFGRLVNTTSASSTGSLQLSYLYDEDGNRTRVTWPDGTYVQYTYDGLNRMDQVRENGAASGQGLLADYSYDVLSRRTNVSRGNGTTTTIYYDGGSRLSDLVHDLTSTSRDLTFGFAYNSASQLVERTLSNDAYSYFSPAQSKSYTRDGLNRYQSVGGVTYGYDGRGNLTSDGSRTFSYDLENHLLSASGGAAPVNFSYDPNGRVLTSSSGGVITRYLYDGDKMVAEYIGSTLLRRYVHGAGTDEPLVWYEGATLTDRRWLHTDHQGSVVASSDGSGIGTVYAYGPYGEPAYDNWSGSRFRYTGQMMLPEAKLYHYKARVYDPILGRFLQTDPVGYKDDVNLYAYVGNDPLNRSDPTGRESACVTVNGCANWANYAPTVSQVGTVADVIPGVNDVKGIVDAVRDPSAVNIVAAGVGLVPGVGDVAGKAIKTGGNILENAAKGAKAEAQVASKLGDQVAGQRVTLESSTGKRSVADIVTADKGVVEVKSGGATLSPGQKAVQADVNAGRPVTPRGQNAERAGLEPGKPVQMNCYRVERCP